MDSVLRHDIIKFEFEGKDVLLGVKKMQEQIDDIKKSVKGVGNSEGFDKVKESVNKAKEKTEKFKEVLDKTAKTSLKGLANGFKTVGKMAGKAAISVGKIGVAAMTTATAGVGALVTSSVKAYGDYEQNIGGIQTLFKDDWKTVLKQANDAYESVGVSANDYMSTVTSFSSSLLRGLGGDTKEAAKLSNQAMVDIADNANKFGNSLESTLETYRSLSRGNFEMLDNLALGYAGSKSGMAQLINDSGVLNVEVVTGNKGNFDEVATFDVIVKAIHKIQKDMGIVGTTEKEATTTIQGSLNAVKSAYENLITSLVIGGDTFDQCVENFIDSAKTFGKNVKPAILKGLEGVGKLITAFTPYIESEFPKLIDTLLPPLLSAATALVKAFIKALPSVFKIIKKELPNIIKQLGEAIVETFGGQMPMIEKFGEKIAGHAKVVAKIIPGIVALIVSFKTIKGILGLLSMFNGLNKKSKAAGKSISSFFGDLAKVKTKTVIKGMGNLMIIIGGLTAIAAAIMFLSPHMAALTDTKSFLKVVGAITILGVVGTALTYFSKITGNIPIKTVAKAMLNMTIVLGSMTLMAAAIMFLSPHIAALTDTESFLKLVGAITILGVVGSVLAIFAGIVGAIPITMVLTGIGSIAAVITAFTGIVSAFAGLSMIDGFNDFIKSGGETLALLVEQLGKVAASFAKGFLETLSSALPAIGENIAQFMTNMKAAFEAVKGVNLADFGSFLTAIAGFIVAVAADKIVSFFAGDLNLAGIGGQLSAFALAALPAFMAFKLFPDDGIEKAPKILESLAKIGNYEFRSGGFLQSITGEVDLGGIGVQLDSFAHNAQSAFNCFSEYPDKGIANAPKILESLAKIGNYEFRSGGFLQSITGEVDLGRIGVQLDSFAHNAQSAYNCFSEFPQKGITFGTRVIKSLAEMSSYNFRTDGVFQAYTGEVNLNTIGKQLDDFAHSTQSAYNCFSEFSDTGIKNANRVFKSIMDLPQSDGRIKLSDYGKQLDDFAHNAQSAFNCFSEFTKDGFLKANQTANALRTIGNSVNGGFGTTQIRAFSNALKNVDAIFDKLTAKAGELPKKMGNAIRNAGNSLSSALVSIWNNALNASVSVMNNIVNRSNQILTQVLFLKSSFTSKTKSKKDKKYAGGTNGHMGGNALINDGNGAELVLMPNGNAFIPKGKNILIPNAPKGMKVLSAENTAALLGRKMPLFKYANGNIKQNDDFFNSHVLQNDTYVNDTSDNFSYSPTFNLTINGSNMNEHDLKRKVKEWFKESNREYFESLSRRRPRTTLT